MIPGRRLSKWEAYQKWNITTLSQLIADLRVEINEKTPLVLNKTKYTSADELITRDGKNFSEYWIEPVLVKELQLF